MPTCVFVFSVGGGYYTTLNYDIIYDVFVLFKLHLLKQMLIWFDTLVSGQSL